jgi:hypothetical protein
MFSCRLICLCILILELAGSKPSHAQPSTQLVPRTAKSYYVLIPTTGLVATHVRTKRVRQTRTEFLDFINVLLPSSFARQQVLKAQDITGAGGLFLHDELLVTMTVLPTLSTGQVNWVPIALDSLGTRQLPWQRVAEDCFTRLFHYEKARFPQVDEPPRRGDFRPIIKINKQYFTTQQPVLTQYYLLRDYFTWFPTSGDAVTINRSARPFTAADYAKELELTKALRPNDSFKPQVRRELETKLLLQKVEGQVYTYWSLPLAMSENLVEWLGASALRYQPNVGLISGTYPSYFGLDDASIENTFFELISIEQLAGK